MSRIAATVALTVIFTFAAERRGYLKKRPVLLGLWFGIPAIAANFFVSDIAGLGVPVGLRDVPPLIAGFFFGPVAGIVAGVVSALGRVMMPLWGVGSAHWLRGAFVTLAVAGYAAALGKWVFDGKRPPVVTAAVAAAFGEVLHLSLDYCLGFHHLAHVLETIYAAAIPTIAGAAVTAGICAFICGSWRGWRNNFYSTLTLAFVCFGMALSVIASISLLNARKHTETALTEAVDRIEQQCDAQIGYMLHCNAVSIADYIGSTRRLSLGEMQKIADNYDVDELNVFDLDGRLVATNNRSVKAHNPVADRHGPLLPFFELLDGKRTFVKQPFRPNRSDPKTITKYIGVRMPDGKAFLQLGYTWHRFEEEFDDFFFPMLADARFGENGYFLIVDEADRVVVPVRHHPQALGRTLGELGFRPRDLGIPAGGRFHARINGVWCRCLRYSNVGKWRLYAVLPLVEYHGPAVLDVFVSGFVLFAACLVFRLLILKFRRTQRKIDELRLAEEKRREADLDLASRIQLSQLRTDDPETAHYRVKARMTHAREVGGDFYDYYELADGRLVVTVADVSGKGVPAAFFMMKAKSTLKSCVFRADSVAEALNTANRRLHEHNDAFMFVTAWVGVFDPRNGVLEYVSAGHNPPFVRRADGRVERIDGRRSVALAAFGETRYSAAEMRLNPGDVLLLYTDGVTEAMTPAGELYGEERLAALLARARGEFIAEITSDIDEFSDGAPRADDVTILTLEIK
jgi:serine phosphatase RsbU (regulator of sigma subunit)